MLALGIIQGHWKFQGAEFSMMDAKMHNCNIHV